MKAVVTCLALWLTAFAACASEERVCFIKINGAIGPATASYIARSIGETQSRNAQFLVIQLNTPGGLLDSTQLIVQSLLASPIPVVVYVAPTGATATSAGLFHHTRGKCRRDGAGDHHWCCASRDDRRGHPERRWPEDR